MTTVGVIANPAAGKDVRRLVAHAAPVADGTKVGMLRRLLAGVVEGGADRLLLAPDRRSLTVRALEGLAAPRVEVAMLDLDPLGDRSDTVAAARAMVGEADVVVVLGGDGTCRDVATGWPHAPLVALSTGTNNVFPRTIEPTVAGFAAGLVTAGAVPLADVARAAKVLHLDLPGGPEVALVEIALVDGHSTGSRAVWEPGLLRAVVAAIAEPDAVGLSTVAAALIACDRADEWGVVVHVGTGGRDVRVPLLPGGFRTVHGCTAELLRADHAVRLTGPGVLALDGERSVVLRAGDAVSVTLRRDGPRVIDVHRTLAIAAAEGRFRSDAPLEAACPPSS
jgi:hypothetical protein